MVLLETVAHQWNIILTAQQDQMMLQDVKNTQVAALSQYWSHSRIGRKKCGKGLGSDYFDDAEK